MNHVEVSKAVREAMKDRMKFQKEAMREYDADVYFPAMNVLRSRCAELGHKKGNYHRNGLGCAWWYCSICGVAFDKHEE